MISSFRNKGLEELFIKGKTNRLPQERLKKIKMILAMLEAATDIRDLNAPALRLHKLKKPPFDGFWSVDISGNYRIIFQFDEGTVTDVDYLDTH